MYLKDDAKWPSNSPDPNVTEMLWAIIKARINLDNIKTEGELFEQIKKIWDEIPMSTINLLIESFDSRLKTCINLKGESLNGKKKIRKKFQNSYQIGNNYIEKKNEENKLKENFIYASKRFFNRLKFADMNEINLSRLNVNESTNICKILPQYFLDKVNMPKPFLIQGGKIYV